MVQSYNKDIDKSESKIVDNKESLEIEHFCTSKSNLDHVDSEFFRTKFLKHSTLAIFPAVDSFRVEKKLKLWPMILNSILSGPIIDA